MELHRRLCGDDIDDCVAITKLNMLDVVSVLHMN